jgi:signal transduction histidine kinase
MSVGGGVSELTIHRGDEEMTVRLARQFIVGSRPDADLVLEGIPPTHFIINPGKSGALMLVLERPESVQVNGVPARQAQRLAHGDALRVAGVTLRYRSPSDSNPQMSLVREPTPRATPVAELQSSIVDSQSISWFTTESDVYRALRTLYQLSNLSNSASSESGLLEGALDLALQGGGATQGAIVGQGDGGDVVPVFVRRPAGTTAGPNFALDQVLVSLKKGHTSVANAPGEAPSLCVPIVRPGSPPEGAICLKRGDGDAAFTTSEVELVVSIGRQLGSALERVRMIKALRSSALDLSRLQRRHEAALHAISEGLVLVGADRTVEPLSARGRELLALVLGGEPRDGDRLEGDGPLAQAVARALADGETVVEELEAADEHVVRAAVSRVASLDAVVLVLSEVTLQRELEDRSREAEARLLTDLVRAREQRRIGQDLHDGVCQQLVGIQMLAKGLEHELALEQRPEAAKAAEIGSLLRQAAEEARSLARGLTVVALQERSFLLALQELITTFGRLSPGITFRFETTGTPPPIEAEVATQLYHIVQEALSNACKHSGARSVSVFLTSASNGVVVAVEDDGVGLPQNADRKGGMGLGNMKHRARLIGGTLELEGGARGGTRVTFSLRNDERRGEGEAPT